MGTALAEVPKRYPDRSTRLNVSCKSGGRSLRITQGLLGLGYTDVVNVKGGIQQWMAEGRPVSSDTGLSATETERYSRHILIPEIGLEGQKRLLKSRVLLLGAGGLGAPSALYLAAAGVGTLGIIDDDVVDRSNLQRQIIHAEDRIGTLKTESATKTLAGLNPDVKVEAFTTRLKSHNAFEILGKDWDVIVDGTDNLPTRYLVNDVSVMKGIPVVHGSIFRFEGQLTVFAPGRGPCYRCLYPEPPPPELAPSCAEGGVLGVLPGIVGSLQAIEAIKLLLNIGEPLIGRLLMYDALTTQFRTLRLRKDPACPSCGEGPRLTELIDYDAFCSIRG